MPKTREARKEKWKRMERRRGKEWKRKGEKMEEIGIEEEKIRRDRDHVVR